MTSLPTFEADAREALLDTAEDGLYDGPDNLAFQLLRAINQNWRDYAGTQGYDLDSIIQSGQVTATRRSSRRVSATLRWGSLANIYEFGVDPFTMTGSPLLAFAWDSPPEGTRPDGAPSFVVSDEINWGSVTGGIPEARAIRGAINYLDFQASGGEITL